MKYLHFLAAMSAALLLAGCGEETTSLTQACERLNGFCETGIAPDSNCKRERQRVILAAYELEITPTPETQYQQLLNLEDMQACAQLQSFIEYIPAKQKFAELYASDEEWTSEQVNMVERYQASTAKRKSNKRRNYINTVTYLRQLSQDTKDSRYPHLLYWHWSRNQDEKAVNALKVLYHAGQIKNYDLLYFLSQEYGPYEPIKTKQLLLEMLERYPPEHYTDKTDLSNQTVKASMMNDDGRLHYAALRALVQLYFESKQYDAAYVYSQILNLNNDMSSDTDMIVDYIRKNQTIDTRKLDKVAEALDDALEDGLFVAVHAEKLISQGA